MFWKTWLILLILALPTFWGLYFFGKRQIEPKYWVGLYKDYNFRDVGESLNSCLNEEKFHKNKIFRSNKYFSGWSCSSIHTPSIMFALNYDPKEPKKYYCVDPNGEKKFSTHFDRGFKLEESHLENPENWFNPKFSGIFCQYLGSMVHHLAKGDSILIHCEAGRDRTGIMVGVLEAGLITRQKKKEDLLKSFSCDYKKTESLDPVKNATLENLFSYFEKELGDPSLYLTRVCHIDEWAIRKASHAFMD